MQLPHLAPLMGLSSVSCMGMAEPAGTTRGIDFVCFHCHGKDAKSEANGMKPRAGMNETTLFTRTSQRMENPAHANVMSGCATAPSAREIKPIARYLAGLPQ